jgi:GxxExxY protein
LNAVSERIAACVLVELKIVRRFDEIHMAQCLNYLRATGLALCLLVNFAAPKVELRRVIDRPDLRSSAFICG